MGDAAPTLWPPTFSGAIFDFDGTIARTGWIWEEVDRAFLGARGIEYSEEYARTLSVLGFGAGAQYTIETYGLHERPEDIRREWTLLSHALYRSRVELRPGVEGYIRSLRRAGVRCALATANEPELIGAMELVDVVGLFDTCVHSCDVGAAKDQPDIYLEAARRLRVPPELCIVFEDIEPGICAARSVGFATCAVRSGERAQRFERVRSAAEIHLDDWDDIELR